MESHKTRRSAFSGIGAEVIHWELEQRKVCNVPSSIIANILSRYGKTGKVKNKRNGNSQPYPYIKVEKMGDLHQTDLVGPRHLRGPKGVIRFYSFHTVDVAGHTAYTSQFPDKQTISLGKHLIEAWRFMGLPEVSQMDNEMAATGGGRYPYSISQVIRLHLLLGVHIERDWLLNKKIRLSSLSLSRLRVILFLLCLQLQGGKLKKGSRCY